VFNNYVAAFAIEPRPSLPFLHYNRHDARGLLEARRVTFGIIYPQSARGLRAAAALWRTDALRRFLALGTARQRDVSLAACGAACCRFARLISITSVGDWWNGGKRNRSKPVFVPFRLTVGAGPRAVNRRVSAARCVFIRCVGRAKASASAAAVFHVSS
jgi:hypothetical protein